MALNSLCCPDVPLRNYSLTHSAKAGLCDQVGLSVCVILSVIMITANVGEIS